MSSSDLPARLRHSAHRGWEGLLGLLYPARCFGCSGPVPAASVPLCARCTIRIERADPAEVAARLARRPPDQQALDAAFALWLFDREGLLQRLHHALKYGNRPHYGVGLGALLGTAYRASCTAERPDAVVPIPLHRARRYERGYNQSAMLARGAAQTLGLPIEEEVVRRTQATGSQTALAQQMRWQNVRYAFSVSHPESLQGRHLLLVDDVFTTGATGTAAAQALKAAGARRVSLAALAYARS